MQTTEKRPLLRKPKQMPQGATLPLHKNSGICRPSHQAHHGAARQNTHKENTHTYLQTQTSSSYEGLSLAFGAKGDISKPQQKNQLQLCSWPWCPQMGFSGIMYSKHETNRKKSNVQNKKIIQLMKDCQSRTGCTGSPKDCKGQLRLDLQFK